MLLSLTGGYSCKHEAKITELPLFFLLDSSRKRLNWTKTGEVGRKTKLNQVGSEISWQTLLIVSYC